MLTDSQPNAISLKQFNAKIAQTLHYEPGLCNVWITAETSDVRMSGSHCYIELIEKDDSGSPVAKARATIWANRYFALANKFMHATGERLRSDMKVMVQVTANFHPVFGLSLNITDINPTFTLGDLMQRRLENIKRLTEEGIINENKNLPWPLVPQRIAIISAKGAAGYGDFIDQLFRNKWHIRFNAKLFEAVMQGERCSQSIIDALEAIGARQDDFDCVVIIRGGGASTDLLAFEDYDLAANIANFPLPVVIGIGHERDITLLDYVAHTRVKTPTAAAALLLSSAENVLGYLQNTAAEMLQAVTDKLVGCHRQLAFIQGQLPAAATHALVRARSRLTDARIVLAGIADRRLRPQLAQLDRKAQAIAAAVELKLAKSSQALEGRRMLVEALSPEATLRRGYSITRVGGHAITNAADAPLGSEIETILAHGTIKSVVT